MNILICGHRAFAARGLADKLSHSGHEVLCFSRGEVMENDNVITGPVDKIDCNPFLVNKKIDAIINFIVLKDRSLDENQAYIDSLVRMAKTHNVSKFIQISSISSYPNDAKIIDENTAIETDGSLKGAYGSLKVGVDQSLIGAKCKLGLPVVFVRPGFIVAEDHPNPIGGIALKLPMEFGIIMGNKQSTLPVIRREVFHDRLTEIVDDKTPLDTYILLDKRVSTKEMYVKSVVPTMKLISLPKGLVIMTAKLLKTMGVFDQKKVCMVTGLFKQQVFNTKLSEEKTSR